MTGDTIGQQSAEALIASPMHAGSLKKKQPDRAEAIASALRTVTTERAGIEAGSDAIDVEHLPPEVLSGGSPERGRNLVSMTWQQAMMLGRREAGRQYLQALLKRFSGRIAEAAIHAGVERESFYRLLRRHGVHVDGTVDDSTNDEPPRPHEED